MAEGGWSTTEYICYREMKGDIKAKVKTMKHVIYANNKESCTGVESPGPKGLARCLEEVRFDRAEAPILSKGYSK